MSGARGGSVTALATPSALVDLDIVSANAKRMAGLTADAGAHLRPHVKTHKSTAIGRMQMEAGATGITVATIGEAETFAGAGFRDIFLAFPWWPSDRDLARVSALHARGGLTVTVDSAAQAGRLAEAAGNRGRRLPALIEVDSGQHRSGVPASDVGRLAKELATMPLELRGVFTHAGHSYASPASVGPAARDEVGALEEACRSLADVGVHSRIVSAGSSPTAVASASAGGIVTEVRPGTYIFNDRSQVKLGVAREEDCALTVLARVVSVQAGRTILDAGSKILGLDRLPILDGFAHVRGRTDLVLSRIYEHHGVLDGVDDFAVGELVELVPNHACIVPNLARELVAVRAGAVDGVISVDAAGPR